MNKIILSSKAQTLIQVESKVSIFVVPRLIILNANKFNINSVDDLKIIKKTFKDCSVALRSSAADEDMGLSSLAGEYDSVLNILASDSTKIKESINLIIESYQRKRQLLPGDSVIVQEMTQNTTMSGVIFTHDLNTGAPYYVINYDDQSGKTDTVTAGNGEHSNRTIYIHRNSVNKLHSDRFVKLLKAVKELELFFDSQFLDIEFALGEDLTPYLLQVRAITTQPNWNGSLTKRINSSLKGVQSFVKEKFKKVNGVYGETSVLGQMPDWNPVEMIGRAPRALSTSLYKLLITDKTWHRARETMGYSVPLGHPLMLTLVGQPFIDTRLCFHSFLPKTLSPIISEKLVNHWVKELRKSPAFHDKIEFNIAITTYSFDIDEKIEQLISNSLTMSEKQEFKESHLKQTIQLLSGNSEGSITKALNKIETLKKKQIETRKFTGKYNLSSLFTIIDECIELGTVPFSILARHGFIAKTILLSLENLKVITMTEVNQIQASVQTVASDLINDMNSLKKGKLKQNEFMDRYGHLRPGTYDIMSPRYDQVFDLIVGSMSGTLKQDSSNFHFSIEQLHQINNLFQKAGFDGFTAEDFLNYVREAIVAREYAKFIFTRSVSDILEEIEKKKKNNELSRDEISHVPVEILLSTMKSSSESNIEERLRKVSEREKELHDISIATRLPQLLVNLEDIYIVPFQVSHPNFITQKKITASCIFIGSGFEKTSLNGKVVIIEGADPGYDWIFSQKISGLITKYGGANSHMAIRCAEFAIPAAIGCGDQRFTELITANRVHLDCAAGLINSIY